MGNNPPQMPDGALEAGSRPTAAGSLLGLCPECTRALPCDRSQSRQLFCSQAHRRAFHDRWKRRGASLVPFAVAARLTRDGTRGDKETGKGAVRVVNQLIAAWLDEDRAKKRMPMVDYVALRIRLGFEPI